MTILLGKSSQSLRGKSETTRMMLIVSLVRFLPENAY